MHYNPNSYGPGGTINIDAGSATAITPGIIDIQLQTVISGALTGNGTFFSNSYTIRVRVNPTADDGGGTCDAVGLGFPALLLPLASLVFIRKRK